MGFTAEELEAMRLADEEIDREFEEKYIYDHTHAEIDKWLDDLAVADAMDHKALHAKRRKKKHQAAYYAEHKEEIAAKMSAYYAEHKEEQRVYMRQYLRDYRKGLRRRSNVAVGNVETLV